MSQVSFLGSRLLLVAALLLSTACATTGSGTEADMSAPPADGAVPDGGTEPTTCFMGTPQSENELLNRCTDAEHVDRAHRVPTMLWDGKGPLPVPPI